MAQSKTCIERQKNVFSNMEFRKTLEIISNYLPEQTFKNIKDIFLKTIFLGSMLIMFLQRQINLIFYFIIFYTKMKKYVVPSFCTNINK